MLTLLKTPSSDYYGFTCPKHNGFIALYEKSGTTAQLAINNFNFGKEPSARYHPGDKPHLLAEKCQRRTLLLYLISLKKKDKKTADERSALQRAFHQFGDIEEAFIKL